MRILCVYGCGGMGREIADLAHQIKQWTKIIFVDDNMKDKVIDNVSVYTFEEVLQNFDPLNLEFIVAAGEPALRKFLYERLEKNNLQLINVMYQNFNLSRFSSIQKGTIIHTGATVTVNVHIGKGCLINKHSVIGHDVTIGDYSVISPNVSIGGDVNIGSNCFLGSGAVIRNGLNIGENSIIGMGSVVLKDVEPNSVVAGNPAKVLRLNENNRVFKSKN